MNETNKKAIKGFKWTGIKTAVNTILQPFFRLFLALLLTPTEYAYIAIILLVVAFAEMLSNMGFGEAIVQRESFDNRDFSTLIYFTLIVNLFLGMAIFLLKDFIASYYELNELDEVLQLLIIIIIINNYTNLLKFVLHREFLFKEETIARITKNLVEVIFTLLLIKLGFGIWAFAFGLFISLLANLVINIYIILKNTRIKIKLLFSFHRLSFYYSFGFQVGLKKILTFLGHRIDEVIVGGILSSTTLGAYSFAKSTLIQIQSLITASISQVMLPFYSKYKYDDLKLKKYYLSTVYFIFSISFPLFLIIFLSADFFVPLIFGDEWVDSIVIFKQLSLPIGLVVLTASIATSLIYSKNYPSFLLILELIITPIYILLIMYYGSNLNEIVFLYSALLVSRFLLIQQFLRFLIKVKWRDYVGNIKIPLIGCFSMVLVAQIIKFACIGCSNTFTMVAILISCIMMYIGVVLSFDRSKFLQLINTFKKSKT